MIYFDYNATTPLDPAVREAMLPFFNENWGNPSSTHRVGRCARAMLDDARERVAATFRCRPSEVLFTSGGTESVNLAIFGTARLLKPKGKHLVTSTVEHAAALQCFDYLEKNEGFEVTRLPVDQEGSVAVESLEQALRPDTSLVSIMAANNEIGTLQPVAALGALCRRKGVCFHTDAVQWFGKEPFENIDQFNADLVSVCAHKIFGPKGAGALFIRSPLRPDPILFGGSHENERRAGTENIAGIIGLSECIEHFIRKPVFDAARLRPLTEDLARFAESLPGVHRVGATARRLANTVALVVEGTDSSAVLPALDIEGICASSGSACAAGSMKPSHVVSALGLPPELSRSLLRFSLGPQSTADEVSFVKAVLPEVLRRAQLYE